MPLRIARSYHSCQKRRAFVGVSPKVFAVVLKHIHGSQRPVSVEEFTEFDAVG